MYFCSSSSFEKLFPRVQLYWSAVTAQLSTVVIACVSVADNAELVDARVNLCAHSRSLSRTTSWTTCTRPPKFRRNREHFFWEHVEVQNIPTSIFCYTKYNSPSVLIKKETNWPVMVNYLKFWARSSKVSYFSRDSSGAASQNCCNGFFIC